MIQSAMAGRGMDRLVDIDAPAMKQSVAWELALRVIHIREVSSLVMVMHMAFNARAAPLPHTCSRCTDGPTCSHADCKCGRVAEGGDKR